jgi:opacity protein-like surface antigen
MLASPRFLCLLFALTAIGSEAYADSDGPCCRPVPHWYAALGGGIVFLNSSDIKTQGTTVQSQGFDSGLGFSAAVGYRFNSGWRTELELAYRDNPISTIGGQSPPSGQTFKDQTSLATMVNGYYDFRNRSAITPYLGAGLGEARVSNPQGGGVVALKAWTPAYQLMVGASYTIPNTPLEGFFGYRFFGCQDPSIRASSGSDYRFSNNANILELGARIFFK